MDNYTKPNRTTVIIILSIIAIGAIVALIKCNRSKIPAVTDAPNYDSVLADRNRLKESQSLYKITIDSLTGALYTNNAHADSLQASRDSASINLNTWKAEANRYANELKKRDRTKCANDALVDSLVEASVSLSQEATYYQVQSSRLDSLNKEQQDIFSEIMTERDKQNAEMWVAYNKQSMQYDSLHRSDSSKVVKIKSLEKKIKNGNVKTKIAFAVGFAAGIGAATLSN